MHKIRILDNKGILVEANFIFSFHCTDTKKNYVALDYQKQVFDKTSTYNNLDILEISKEENNTIYIADIPDSDWEKVKYALQNDVFANINTFK